MTFEIRTFRCGHKSKVAMATMACAAALWEAAEREAREFRQTGLNNETLKN